MLPAINSKQMLGGQLFSLGHRAWQNMETKSKGKVSTHAHRQHRSDFIHGVAVSACTDVGILFPWMVKAQLSSHIPDEGAHPGRASTNTHELKAEDTVSLELYKLTGNPGVIWELPSRFSARPLPRVSKEVCNQLPGEILVITAQHRHPEYSAVHSIQALAGCLCKGKSGHLAGSHTPGGRQSRVLEGSLGLESDGWNTSPHVIRVTQC